MKAILNLGAGKVSPCEFSPEGGYDENGELVVTFHVDGSYKTTYNPAEIMEHTNQSYLDGADGHSSSDVFVSMDMFEFMDSFRFKFDHINADRIFEHMFYDSGQIGRLLDACNQITTDGATMTIIVPDAVKIAKMILELEERVDEMTHSEVEAMKLIINTEATNTRQDPHGSVWTNTLANLYIDGEGRQ